MKLLTGPLPILYGRRELIRELVHRELRDRHAGQVLGVAWAYGHPLLLMLIYTFLFVYVFPARYGTDNVVYDYSGNVLAGMVSWLAFQDLLSRAPTILVGQANLVKKIVFPTEVLPVKTAIASALPYTGGLLFAMAYSAWQERLTWLVLMLPVVVGFQLVAMAGMAFILSAGGVFLRDLRDVVAVFASINLFAQPILYNPLATHSWLHWVFIANPFSYVVWCWQDVLYNGHIAHPMAWVVFPIISMATFALGWTMFQRTRHAFGDAL